MSQPIILSGPDTDRYHKDPLHDQWMRIKYGIPENRYYTVSIYGIVRVDQSRTRNAPVRKISKSNQ
jgi:hypothetical protein